jgi:hypothetical protein
MDMKDSQTQWTGNTFQAKAMMGIIIIKRATAMQLNYALTLNYTI